MTEYNKFKNNFFNTYSNFINGNGKEKYVYKLINDNLIILKKVDNKEKDIYIANDKYARHFGKKLLIRLICKMDNVSKTIKEIDTNKQNIYKVNNVIASHFYKSLEILYYKYLYKKENTTGKIIKWYPNGNIFAMGNLFLGQKNGFWIHYYNNGEKRQTGNYTDGKRSGIFTEWNKMGYKTKQILYLENNKKQITFEDISSTY